MNNYQVGKFTNLLLRFFKAIRGNPSQLLRIPGYATQFLLSNFELRFSDEVLKERPKNGSIEQVIEALDEIGHRPDTWALNKDEFLEYCKRVDYKRRNYYAVGTPYFWEKSLEHYLSIKMLELKQDDIVIDVASDKSVFPELVKDLCGCKSCYRQDLVYEHGIHGDKIGGNAADMPVPDSFATKLALHNAYEHFEGDSDTGFVIEAARVLRPGGRFIILPLFVGLSYYYRSSYFRSRRKVPIDKDAKWYLEKGLLQRHSRFYDIKHLKSRILDYCDAFDITIYYIPDVRKIHPICDCDFVLLGERV